MRVALVLVLLGAACTKHEDPPAKLGVHDQTAAVAAHERAHVAKPPRARPAQLTRVTLKALGMYCEETCPLKVRMALADVPAVYELGFDVSNEAIFVSYDASLGAPKEVTRPMLVAIKSAGFDPWLAKEAWPPEADAAVAVVP
jgi:hypothetical protein